MGQALYRKWRSQTFDEVIGQEHVTRTLRNALQQGRIAHAYLFTGPRGTGKTSTARLLARAVNCTATEGDKPCNQCDTCRAIAEDRLLNLIEIDAASHRGIDDIRDLREKVKFSAGDARFKVYIIDEVHALTADAFNALLKTLEEPPPYVIFVLATTEPHKVPQTVLSRCQRFDFRPIPLEPMVRRLGEIVKCEEIKVQPQALELIARNATGSLRDAISLLDQLSSYGEEEITVARVRDMLGAVSIQAVSALVDRLAAKDLAGGLALINQMVGDGLDPRVLAREVLEYAHGLLLLRSGFRDAVINATPETLDAMQAQAQAIPVADLLRMARLFTQAGLDVKGSVLPQLPLELAYVEAVLPRPVEAPSAAPAPRPAPTADSDRSPQRPATPPPAAARPVPPAAGPAPERVAPAAASPRIRDAAPASAVPVSSPELADLQRNWQKVVASMRDSVGAHLQACLRSSRPVEMDGSQLTIGFQGEWHCNNVNEPKAKAQIEAALDRALGTKGTLIKGIVATGQARATSARAPVTYAPPPTDAAPPAEGPDAAHPVIGYAVNELGARATLLPKNCTQPRPEEDPS